MIDSFTESEHEPTEEKQEHEAVEKDKQLPTDNNSPTGSVSPDTTEAFQQIRRESEILGIAAIKKEDLSTPPPSPADFSTQVSQNSSKASADEGRNDGKYRDILCR